MEKRKSASKALDLSAFEETDVAEMVVQNPKTLDPILAADDKPWTVQVAGPNHPEVIKQRNVAVGKALKATRLRGGIEERPEDVTDDAWRGLAQRIVGWNPPIMNGRALEFTRDAAVELVTNLQWFRNQLQRFVADDASFLKGSAKE